VDDEGEEGYRVGGYHRVSVGEVYGEKYRVRKKLGWGHFSTVWMVDNIKQVIPKDKPQNPKLLALKVI
jgi:serine/threonine-protein kinase SRPK3